MTQEYHYTYVEGGSSYPALLTIDHNGTRLVVNKEVIEPGELGLAYLVTSNDADRQVADWCGHRCELVPHEIAVAIRKRPPGRPQMAVLDRRTSRGVSLSNREWRTLDAMADEAKVSVSQVLSRIIQSNPLTTD